MKVNRQQPSGGVVASSRSLDEPIDFTLRRGWAIEPITAAQYGLEVLSLGDGGERQIGGARPGAVRVDHFGGEPWGSEQIESINREVEGIKAKFPKPPKRR